MKHAIQGIAIVGLLASSAALAQTTTAPTTGNGNGQQSSSPAPAAVSSSDNPRTSAAPVAGANSFTEGEARGRIEGKGFGNVTGLQKDDKGIWRGTAMKDGKSVAVALDFQGNVVGE